ncbi:YVTN family beta-propeller repeat protein [Nostoc sp. PCC 7524]|uniref:peptidoglycan-binding protein n=1 Tax=Nostoc sp. (strain ATCC 29411 / PCC 7524) TaxID=28072 RepID=UPI00029F0E62|nr:peptidoglycan-binding protein [Nostoc sp. PCC 7524]AFY47923.1 YVTN family beta-propeller repeat protein [Nostoc sp. PCC 7524]
MDTLAYLHLAENYEASTNLEQTTITDSDLYIQQPAWENHRSGAVILAVSVALGSLSLSNPALALKRGDRSPQVMSLQQKLQATGYFQRQPTGYFGSLTETAVIRFQKANGLTADGIVGAKTLAALESSSELDTFTSSSSQPTSAVTNDEQLPATSKRVLKRGDKSYQVMSLQRQLRTAGYFEEPITGDFDVATQAAVIKFQRANRLIIDGIAGPQTLSALESNTSKLASAPFLATTPEPVITENQVEVEPQPATTPSRPQRMKLIKTISGKISPKSVVYSGNGLFFAQNMMYNHTITVYNRNYELVKEIPDAVDLSKYGYAKVKGKYRGAPVEASFSHNGKYAWVSNYQMYGPGFNNPGSDNCHPSQKTDKSFLYRINTDTLEIDSVIQVGSVPKYVATSADERLILVSNWCSWDLSVVDAAENREIQRIKLGRYPRGIAVDANSETAYVAVMGSYDIAAVSLRDFSVKWLRNVGQSPRHLNIDPNGKYLYASLNGEGKIAKISLSQRKVINKISTGNAPRSMVLSDDGHILYVVNYKENTVSKVRTRDMKVLQKVNVDANPIGITYDPKTREVWVACYSGNIMIFQD